MMKVFVRNYKGNYMDTTGIWLELPCIPQKGEYLVFSVLEGDDGLSRKEQKLAKESTDFLLADEESDTGNPTYIVISRTFHNNGVVELCVRGEEMV